MEDNCEIFIENVTKTFGGQEVLKTVCVKFEMGKIYGYCRKKWFRISFFPERR